MSLQPTPVVEVPFGKYRLLRRIGAGGMAEVHLARLGGAAGFSKLVVIKQVLPALASIPRFTEMLLDEGRLAARLSHPNIAQTFELGQIDGRYFIALEYVTGESLGNIEQRARALNRPIPLGAALRVQMQLLEALDYAHGLLDASGKPLHVVHRDVSPSNLMVSYHGGVKLLDFGIARAATQTHQTQVGTVKGKLGYMAPEQCRSGPLDGRVDLFAAGAVLFSMVTGRSPYDIYASLTPLDQFKMMAEARFQRPREAAASIPDGLEQIILRAMAKDPDERYRTAGAMLQDLERFASASSLFPSARELGEYVGALFPERAEAAGGDDVQSAVRFIDVGTADLVSEDISGASPGLERASSPTMNLRALREDSPVQRGGAAASDNPAAPLPSESKVAVRDRSNDLDLPTEQMDKHELAELVLGKRKRQPGVVKPPSVPEAATVVVGPSPRRFRWWPVIAIGAALALAAGFSFTR